MAALLAVGLAIGARDLARSEFIPLDRQMLDFRVEYCSGVAVDARADPYRIEPQRSCEHRYPERLLSASANILLPFDLPGYDAGVLGALALLPFPVAAKAFESCTLLAIAASIWLIARTLQLPLLVVVAAIALSQFPTITLGQLTGFELLALAATGAALHAGRDRLAGVLAGTTLIEPHVGIFVIAAVAAFVPRARIGMIASVAAAAVFAIAVTSPREQLAYVTTNLPAQAVASARSDEQYSLAYLATLVGISDRTAVIIGSASTALMLVLAIGFARASNTVDRRAGIAFLPAACAVVGGAYVHLAQEALAVPGALLLVKLSPNRTARWSAGVALVLLAIPWHYPLRVKALLAFSLVTCAVLVWFLSNGSLRTTACAIIACAIVLFWAENHPPRSLPIPAVRAWPADALAEDEWHEVVERYSLVDAFRIGAKVPTWIGLIGLLTAGVLTVRRPPARLA